MKGKVLSVALLCVLGVGVVSGCGESGYEIEITNKEEIEADWHVKDADRTLEVTLTYEDEVQNPYTAINTGELIVTSSNTDAVVTNGLNLLVMEEGKATITAEYHGHKDKVNVTILPEAEGNHSWSLNTEYFLGITDSNGTIHYVTGTTVSSYYTWEGTLSTSMNSAVPVILTEGDGMNGYYMSFVLDGTTYYITIMDNDGHINLQYVTEEALIYWDADNGVFCNEDKTYFLGYYSSYDCLYAESYSSYLGSVPSAELFEIPDVIPEDEPLFKTAEWSVGNKYLLGYEKNGSLYYYNGEVLNSYYGDVSTNVSNAVPVLVETCGDGYSLKLDNGYYLGYALNESHHNFKWDLTDPFEWIYDEDLNAFGAYDGDTLYVMGASGSFNEIAMISISGTYYVAHLYDYVEPTAPTSITLSAPVTSIYVGMKSVVSATVAGDENVDNSLTWSITTTQGATVTDGVVTSGTGAETVTVTAASKLDPNVVSDSLSIVISAVPSNCVGILDFGAVTETGGTKITDANDLNDCWVGTSSVFTGLSAIDSEKAPVTRGTGTGGAFPNTAGIIKFGISGSGGKLTFNFATGTTIKSATICAHGWYKDGNNSGDTADKLTVGSTDLELSYSGTPTEVTWSDSTGVSSLTLSTSNAQSKRCYVFYIVLYSSEQNASNSIG